MESALYMRDEKNKWLHYADNAVRLVTHCLPGIYRVSFDSYFSIYFILYFINYISIFHKCRMQRLKQWQASFTWIGQLDLLFVCSLVKEMRLRERYKLPYAKLFL